MAAMHSRSAAVWLMGLCVSVVAVNYQHPQLGFPTGCDLTKVNDCAPTYADLQANGSLWPCPTANSPAGTCFEGCTTGNDQGLCQNLSPSEPCCCPVAGCYVGPQFNQIIGVCKGEGCACGGATAPGCAPQGDPLRCGTTSTGATCTGPAVPCCFGNNVTDLEPYYQTGSQVVLNYMAAYAFDNASRTWRRQDDSSFNVDGSKPAFDLMKPYGGLQPADAWLGPQPGGSVYWSLAYYNPGVPGVAGDGLMFVLSTEQFWAATWYMLNQVTLDRGPAVGYPADQCPVTNNNCWAGGNAGEMDFLEPAWQEPNNTRTQGYRRSFDTQFNQVGRCFNGGVNQGGFQSDNYVVTSGRDENRPYIYVALVDSVGNWLYRIPAENASTIWPGLNRTHAAATLQAAPTMRPQQVNPCVDGFCAVFTSNCQATNWSDAQAENCAFNPTQGMCGNWFQGYANTGQPLFPDDNCDRDVRNGKTMPWCKAMVN
ncbi:uncharacterized protein MONBRDRAFT_12712 [Monosiga brevicollis MX1]|uniref:Uncharacterized protein n=1 Tax=Monosiga brevicollis TaxID=81824 RepID=A9VD37_MONBE|nr:uncharacterized protein MONBRDRAFT_12712 [Monosiga brevicollis MX1]EDQ84572.1 predicted protein [Monosiga brevicollis MX1]|eukprot:XP_001750599.1 hypothetical protein [Monosiga brevicollis MX1]